MAIFHRDDHLAALRKVPLFAGLDSHHLERVVQLSTELSEPDGRVLAGEGEYGRELIILLEGQARVERGGKEVARLKAGQFFGEISLIDGKQRTATITTEGPCTVLVVEPRALWALLETVPELNRAIMLALCARLREAYDAISL
jgi:CRP/FNR family cyclic AMP-dependent transcriptional regulator